MDDVNTRVAFLLSKAELEELNSRYDMVKDEVEANALKAVEEMLPHLSVLLGSADGQVLLQGDLRLSRTGELQECKSSLFSEYLIMVVPTLMFMYGLMLANEVLWAGIGMMVLISVIFITLFLEERGIASGWTRWTPSVALPASRVAAVISQKIEEQFSVIEQQKKFVEQKLSEVEAPVYAETLMRLKQSPVLSESQVGGSNFAS